MRRLNTEAAHGVRRRGGAVGIPASRERCVISRGHMARVGLGAAACRVEEPLHRVSLLQQHVTEPLFVEIVDVVRVDDPDSFDQLKQRHRAKRQGVPDAQQTQADQRRANQRIRRHGT